MISKINKKDFYPDEFIKSSKKEIGDFLTFDTKYWKKPDNNVRTEWKAYCINSELSDNSEEDCITKDLKKIENLYLSDFDVKHINETPSYVPQAKPKEPLFKLNSKKLNAIWEKKKNNIRTPFQYLLFKIKNIDFSSNIFVWRKKILDTFKTLKIKLLLIPAQKFNKYIERQIFLSNLTRQQRESLKSMNFDSKNMDINSAIVKLVIKKNFDLKSLKDSIEKQKKRQKEREDFAQRLTMKQQNIFRDRNNNHLLFE